MNISRLNARVIISETITTDKLAAGAVTADKIDVNELSAISANLGTITAGLLQAVTIIGSYIATAQNSFPKIEFSSSENLLKASASNGNYVAISPSTFDNSPAVAFYQSSLARALLYFSALANSLTLVTVGGIDLDISAGGDLNLSAGIGGLIRFTNWSAIYNNSNGQTLQAALNAKQNVITGASGTFTTMDGKTVTVSNGIVTSIV